MKKYAIILENARTPRAYGSLNLGPAQRPFPFFYLKMMHF